MNRILVVRRDNIGDLVCTTPLFTALRRHYPKAWIGALVNSYNAPVLDRNPDLDEVLAYSKLKHLGANESRFETVLEQLGLVLKLRRKKLDCIVLAGSPPPFLSLLGPARTVRHDEASPLGGRHEVERVFALGRELGIEGPIPPLRLVPDAAEVGRARAAAGADKPIVAVAISARRPPQRWPSERFAALIGRLVSTWRVLLLWSPGAADDPRHPGDDEKAAEILKKIPRKESVVPYPTLQLPALIGALAACDAVICPDGGASHLAAALQKPVVALFGDSPAERWRPWGVAHRVLQPASRNVADIEVDEVLAALASIAPGAGVFRHPAA